MPGELLEQDGLALHDGLAGQRADVAQAEHGGAVADDGDQVAAGGQVAGGVGVGDDGLARRGDAGGVGQGQVALGGHALRGLDGQVSRGAAGGGNPARPCGSRRPSLPTLGGSVLSHGARDGRAGQTRAAWARHAPVHSAARAGGAATPAGRAGLARPGVPAECAPARSIVSSLTGPGVARKKTSVPAGGTPAVPAPSPAEAPPRFGPAEATALIQAGRLDVAAGLALAALDRRTDDTGAAAAAVLRAQQALLAEMPGVHGLPRRMPRPNERRRDRLDRTARPDAPAGGPVGRDAGHAGGVDVAPCRASSSLPQRHLRGLMARRRRQGCGPPR